jgi:hypothetical protein
LQGGRWLVLYNPLSTAAQSCALAGSDQKRHVTALITMRNKTWEAAAMNGKKVSFQVDMK